LTERHLLPRRVRIPAWRREALRTTLWLVPTLQIAAAVALFFVTYAVDRRAYDGDLTLPSWVNNGGADAARQILVGIAAAVITVIGLVFSITIVALTLASTQFGPRMLRKFVRDRGTQVTLGTFVATSVYALLALGSIEHGARGDFVPHLSITVSFGLVLADLGLLVYFIHHVAESIQLPQVIAGIAGDLATAIEAEAIAGNGGRVSHGRSFVTVAWAGPTKLTVTIPRRVPVYRLERSVAGIVTGSGPSELSIPIRTSPNSGELILPTIGPGFR